MSEIETFPKRVLRHHYPDIPDLGDFTTIKDHAHDPVSLLVGGTPCQSFSVAGLRQGLADPRGNLMLEFGALARRLRARWLVWENVPGVLSSNGGRDFAAFLGMLGELGYGFAYRVLDAQYFNLAQRRQRVFVVGHSGGLWQRAAAVLFEPESLRGDPAPRREAREGVANGSQYGASRSIRAQAQLAHREDVDELIVASTVHGDDLAPTLIRRMESATGSTQDAACVAIPWDPNQITSLANRSRCEPGGPIHTLPAAPAAPAVAFGFAWQSAFGSSPTLTAPTQTKSQVMAVHHLAAVRRLTPRECERLQGFPDDYTAIPGAKDGPRYRALGNSFAVPVVRWIGQRIQLVEGVG